MEALLRQVGRRGALVVLDLGFGDAGKGRLVDSLVRRSGARRVVRWNGGAQAGHTVQTADGRVHTFAQVGAGSFVPGVHTLLSRHVRVDPLALLVEVERLAALGVDDVLARLQVDSRARVITPYHVALNRLREGLRGSARHGSCGSGVGECTRDGRENRGQELLFGHLLHRPTALRRLAATRDRLAEEARCLPAAPGHESLETERRVFHEADLASRWLAQAGAIARAVQVLDADGLRRVLAQEAGPLILEGAQGVLLDEHVGFHPFTTWSTCTPDAAHQTLREAGFAGPLCTLGVLRAYLVRHGPGPLPSETPTLDGLAEPHNSTGPWQGRFRRGWFDLPLLSYALAACRGLGAPVDALALTHLDALPRLASWQAVADYGGFLPVPPARGDLDAAAALAQDLAMVRPRCVPLGSPHAHTFATWVAQQAGLRVAWAAVGPRAGQELAF